MTRDFERRCASIREAARDLLAREGIGGFTMERVADEAGYARTAIYRFFPSKRELLVDLALESLEVRLELYRRAASFDARSRERMVAFGEVTCLLYPRRVMPQVLAQSASGRARRIGARSERLRELQRRDDALVAKVAEDAVASGDLRLDAGLSVEEVVFALRAFTQGIFERVGSLPPNGTVADPRAVLRRAGGRFLDGLGWRPLSSEWDYGATLSRVYREVFPAPLLASMGLIANADPASLRSAGARD
jgi:AcrR family transcriptional regulator